ncbi:hypothetical protein LCGC14_1697480 [marine sediment metagenome]|uniref:Uncharacterized protein n=1 Tax=marine sediment metagenome TaxID=412755 RepID=A0A0F9JZH5_9ZZZZ
MKTKAHIQYRSEKQFQKNGKGIRFPGVTTITNLRAKPALIKWANNLGLKGIDSTKYVDDKADIGTLAHAMITNGLQTLETDLTDYTAKQIKQAENCVLSYYEWEKEHKIDPILIEKPLVSEEHCVGGTMDIYAKVDGVFELIDLKTGNGIWDEHKWQVAAYKEILQENNYQVDRVRILNIPRHETENFQQMILSDKVLTLGWVIFFHLLCIYRTEKLFKDL